MRSDLVLGHFLMSPIATIVSLASKATRKLHKPNTRLQDTTNEVLGRFQTSNPGSRRPSRPHGPAVETRRAA